MRTLVEDNGKAKSAAADKTRYQVSKVLRGNVKYLFTKFPYGHARCLVRSADKTGCPLAGIKAQTVLSKSRIGSHFHRCGDHVNVIWSV